jgi:hypothetical protein
MIEPLLAILMLGALTVLAVAAVAGMILSAAADLLFVDEDTHRPAALCDDDSEQVGAQKHTRGAQ